MGKLCIPESPDFRMSWLSDFVKDAALNRDPVKILKDDDGVFIRGRGFGMEFPKAVVLGLTEVADMLRTKDMPLAPCELQDGAVCYIPVPGCIGVVVVQPQAFKTRFLKRLPEHKDDCDERDEDEDAVDCECAGPFRLSTRVNMEDWMTVVERPGKSSLYVPGIYVPVMYKYSVELETACAIFLSPENVEELLNTFESGLDDGKRNNKRQAEADCKDCDAKKPRC